MKHRLKMHQLLLLAVLLALVLACGAVVAYMFMRDGSISTQFEPAKVAVKVTQSMEGEDTIKTIVLTNDKDGGSNILAYLRVRLVSHWEDSGGNIIAKASPAVSFAYDNTLWVAGSGNTYYYKTPVAPGASTPNLLPSGGIVLQQDADGNRQVIDIFAEAIQAKPTTAAVSSWVVTVDDSTEEITAAP